VVLLDWANHFEPRANELGLGLFAGAISLLAGAWVGALLAGRIQNPSALQGRSTER
jgi:hypothetical protein